MALRFDTEAKIVFGFHIHGSIISEHNKKAGPTNASEPASLNEQKILSGIMHAFRNLFYCFFVKSVQIGGSATGHQTIIYDHFLINPVSARIDQVSM
jgi:hypothetical protein